MNYVFLEKNKKYKAVGLTTEEYTFGKKNMPLVQNTQKGDNERSFVRNGIISQRKERFSNIKNNYEFSKEDFSNVKSKIHN